MGVPQGSVIAPLLFNIMVHDVESCVQGKVVLTMYADDLAIWLDTHVRRPPQREQQEHGNQHENLSGSGGRGDPVHASEQFHPIHPENSLPAHPYLLTTLPRCISKNQR